MDFKAFSTPASIDAYCRAEADRRAYFRGEAPEMDLPEPDRSNATRVRKLIAGRAVSPSPWYSSAALLPDMAPVFDNDDRSTVTFIPKFGPDGALLD